MVSRLRTLKRPEGRAPGRGVYAASTGARQHFQEMSNSPSLRMFRRAEARASIRLRVGAANGCIRRDDGRCSTAIRAHLSQETLSRDSVQCNGRLSSNAPHPG